MSNAGDWDGAVKATTRLACLTKPGGYIQLVDSALPIQEIEEGDPPSLKLMKTLGKFLGSFGLNNHAGDKLDKLLRATGEVVEIGHKEAGCPARGEREG